MRKIGLLILSLALVLAFTAQVMAETKVTFSGQYRVRYFQRDNITADINGNAMWKDGSNGYQAPHSAFFDQRFVLSPTFIVSDCLRLVTQFRALVGNQWGQAASGGTEYPLENGPVESEVLLNRVFAVIDTPYGEFRVGRMLVGIAGTALLGYGGGRYADATGFNSIGAFDWDVTGHRIAWMKKWGGFGLSLVYQKDLEIDSGNQGVNTGNLTPGYDDDQDQFWILPQYEWKNGAANFLAAYIRSRSSNGPTWAGTAGTVYNTNNWATVWANRGLNAQNVLGNAAVDWDAWMFNPAIVLNFGQFSFHGEFAYMWAKFRPDESIYTLNAENITGTGWGFYLDGIYNYGPGEAGAMFSYASAPDYNGNNNDKLEGILGITDGGDQVPFLVAYDQGLLAQNAFIGNGPFNGSDVYGYSSFNNHWMVGAYNDYNVTDDLMLHAALGYFELVKTPDVVGFDMKKDLGVEFDVGAYYQIMDGLWFGSMFGYFWGGKAWKYGVDAVDVGNAYVWKNQLTLNF